MRKLKAAIWGAGFIAGAHAQAIAAAGVELAAVVSADSGRTKAFAEKYGAARFGTDPAILFSGDIDAVHVCSPPHLHGEMVNALLEKNIAVLCEKPLALHKEDAALLAAKAAERKTLNAVNFNLRYHEALQAAKALAAGPGFGPVKLVHGNYLQEFHALPAPYGWRYDSAVAGKMRAVTEIGSHWFDIAQEVSGLSITAVQAVFGSHNPVRYVKNGVMVSSPAPGAGELTVASEDSALVTMELSGGALASVVLCETSHGRINHLSLEVSGQDKSLWWNSEDIGRLHSASKGSGVNTQIFAFGDNGFAGSFRGLSAAFYAALQDKLRAPGETSLEAPGQSLPDFAAAARVAAVCGAVYESAVNGGVWVEVS
jgi:predicted dehydrogenase